MKVILLSDVKNVGKKDEVVEVADGYARNFLIKRKLAVAQTQGSMQVLGRQQEEARLREEELEKEAQKTKERLEKIVLECQIKTGNGGRSFGSISTKQIAEQLAKEHDIHLFAGRQRSESRPVPQQGHRCHSRACQRKVDRGCVPWQENCRTA